MAFDHKHHSTQSSRGARWPSMNPSSAVACADTSVVHRRSGKGLPFVARLCRTFVGAIRDRHPHGARFLTETALCGEERSPGAIPRWSRP